MTHRHDYSTKRRIGVFVAATCPKCGSVRLLTKTFPSASELRNALADANAR